jgi:hypothetical protein
MNKLLLTRAIGQGINRRGYHVIDLQNGYKMHLSYWNPIIYCSIGKNPKTMMTLEVNDSLYDMLNGTWHDIQLGKILLKKKILENV